ncbi:MAG: DinB family protein [Gemmatimonadaceae bacterium]
MHPRIAELLAYLDKQHENFRSAYELVAPELRMLRPAAERWSPAEIVHHVMIVEQRIVEYLVALVDQARLQPAESDVSPLFPMRTAAIVELRTRRVRTLDYAEPRDTDAERIWSNYLTTRAALKQIITDSDGLALGAVTAEHPTLGALSGYEWIAFAGAHAARHADQIREMTLSLA